MSRREFCKVTREKLNIPDDIDCCSGCHEDNDYDSGQVLINGEWLDSCCGIDKWIKEREIKK